MMHVPTGPDGERERGWMTAGVLCVHGAEQGESLCGTEKLSLSRSLSPSLLSLLLPAHKYKQNQELSVELLLSTSLLSMCRHTVTLKMVRPNALSLSPPSLHSLIIPWLPLFFLLPSLASPSH